MRRALALCAVLVVGLAPTVAATGPMPAGPGPGYFATDNLTWQLNIPLHADSAGARIVGKTLYITDDRGLTIYDLTDPALPKPVGLLPSPQLPYFPEEDVDTNGKILLIGAPYDGNGFPVGGLYVIDVRDPAHPTQLSMLEGADDHTVSCVLDCTFAWLNSGGMVDLRDPVHPKRVGNFLKGTGVDYTHDVTEVSPGIVVTSSNPVLVLDARRDPLRPKVIAQGSPGDDRFIHANYWPRGGKDRFLLVGGETNGQCDGETSGSFMVFDTKNWQRTKSLKMTSQFRLVDGVPTEGNPAVSTWCAHWFRPHPTFRDGGVVAMGWYEHGARLLNVSTQGQISDVGWFLPLAGQASAAYWVDKSTLYVVDYQRGIDILTWNGKASTRVVEHKGTAPVPTRRVGFRVEGRPGPDQPWFCPRPV